MIAEHVKGVWQDMARDERWGSGNERRNLAKGLVREEGQYRIRKGHTVTVEHGKEGVARYGQMSVGGLEENEEAYWMV